MLAFSCVIILELHKQTKIHFSRLPVVDADCDIHVHLATSSFPCFCASNNIHASQLEVSSSNDTSRHCYVMRPLRGTLSYLASTVPTPGWLGLLLELLLPDRLCSSDIA